MSLLENLNHFFKSDGRTVILPIDHGMVIPVPGLERPADLIESVYDTVDGFVVNFGIARACHSSLEGKGVCLRTDGYKPAYPGNPDMGSCQIFQADDAKLVGAQAMMNMCYLHHPRESHNFRECAALISDGVKAEIPVILESLPFGIGRPEDYTVENIGFAVRFAAELGANVVKTAFPTGGTVDDFKGIVEAAVVPVVVLGGASMGDDVALLTMVKNAMEAGASGIAIGRNVWQHENPKAMATAMKAIVHDDATVSSALSLLKN